MIDDGQPVEELRAAVESLSEDRARTLLGWLRTMKREREGGAFAPVQERSSGPLADMLGIISEREGHGRSRMRLTVDPAWHNPNGVLHGGAIYTLIDYSMGGAVQPDLPPGEHTATIEVKVSYLASVREGTLWVETQVVKQGRNIAFTESKVWDHNARLVATASGTMFIRPSAQD
jgi:acyl-CoA thioesterase